MNCSWSANLSKDKLSCPRPAIRETFCALHDPINAADPERLRAAVIEEIHSSTGKVNLQGVVFQDFLALERNAPAGHVIDFSGAQFLRALNLPIPWLPKGGQFRAAHFLQPVTLGAASPVSIDYALDFGGSHFYHALLLQNVVFGQIIGFDGCEFRALTVMNVDFKRNVSFLNVNFIEQVRLKELRSAELFRFVPKSCSFNVHFEDCDFRNGADFTDAKFQNGVDFFQCHFAQSNATSFDRVEAPKGSSFIEVSFLGDTSFSNCVLSNQRTFKKLDLSGANLLDIRPSLAPDELEDVTWPRKKYLGLFQGRYYVHNEVKQPRSRDVCDFYRRLYKKYYSSTDFVLASEFYVSFMVIKRRITEGRSLERFVNLVYSLLGRYGESIKRPVILLLLMWLFCPALLLYFGLRLETGGQLTTGAPWDSASTFAASSKYWKSFLLNLSLSTFFQTNPLRPELTSWQNAVLIFETAMNALLGAFTGIAIRRSFASKKQLD